MIFWAPLPMVKLENNLKFSFVFVAVWEFISVAFFIDLFRIKATHRCYNHLSHLTFERKRESIS